MRHLVPWLLLVVPLAATAGKKSVEVEDLGIPLVVTVTDARTGLPVPFASVREQQEKELHPVNRENGQFSTTTLYPSYNEEIPLTEGMPLVIEVTAATYSPREVRYTMRKRKNKILVTLEPMDIPPNIGSEPVFQFGRAKPLDGTEMSAEDLARIEAEAEAARQAREAEAAE
jgi:hypothetical protein